jgi:L-ascorbate metabolism protein UlaG (beta-lactamase superfamily)
VRAPGIAIDDLPKIDLVLVSHNHYDHLDVATLQRLWQRDQPRIVTPLGNARIMKLAADEMDWGDSLAVGNRARIVATPLQHWSARSFSDHNQALWAGFVIDVPGGAIFFAGDTGLGSGWWIDPVRAAVADLRLALLPIGAYAPRWFMKDAHMNPAEAVEAFQRLGARNALAIHFGVFPLADDGFDEAERDFLAARAEADIPPDLFRTLQPGESWRVE